MEPRTSWPRGGGAVRVTGALLLTLLTMQGGGGGGVAAGDLFSPLSPLISPLNNLTCEVAMCGKGKCVAAPGSNMAGYKCVCDPGWTQLNGSDASDFLPCVIPNCTIQNSCSNSPSAPAPAPLPPRNFSILDPCSWMYCGPGGSCVNGTSILDFHCECREGYGNLLNITTFPCFQNCSLGADCRSAGILPFPGTNSSSGSSPPGAPGSPPASSSSGSSQIGNVAIALGSIPLYNLLQMLAVATLVLFEAM